VRVELTNLGPVKQATIDVRPLTVLIGPNNTGKTHVAQAVYWAERAFADKLRAELGSGRVDADGGHARIRRLWNDALALAATKVGNGRARAALQWPASSERQIADGVFVLPRDDAWHVIIVELKGTNVVAACQQIAATWQCLRGHLPRESHPPVRFHGFIGASNSSQQQGARPWRRCSRTVDFCKS